MSSRYWQDRLDTLTATMDPAHVVLVNDAITAGDHQPRVTPAGRLAAEVVRRVRAPYEPQTLPLALPPEVAEVYLADGEVKNLHACQQCGYRLPVHCAAPVFGPWGPTYAEAGHWRCGECHAWGSVDGRPPPECGFRRYFEVCPLCGGPVETLRPGAR